MPLVARGMTTARNSTRKYLRNRPRNRRRRPTPVRRTLVTPVRADRFSSGCCSSRPVENHHLILPSHGSPHQIRSDYHRPAHAAWATLIKLDRMGVVRGTRVPELWQIRTMLEQLESALGHEP